MSGIEFGRSANLSSRIQSPGLDQLREQSSSAEIAAGQESGGDSVTFGDFLKKMVQDANQAQLTADAKIQDVAVGRSKDLHGAMLAMEKADIQFRMLTQVRNKLIDAYREIMRMQV